MAEATLREKVQAAADAIRKVDPRKPAVGIILGTGLGALAKEIENRKEISYADIPHFPMTSVTSHAGQAVVGTIEGRTVVAMEGRFHFYEGYTLEEVTLPVRVMKELGAETLIVSNACGGMNPGYKKGDLMIIDDHINLMGINPLIGENDDELGPRFPDMCEPYSRELINLAVRIAKEENIRAHTGVYVAVTGPNLETRAEYRFLRIIGSDVVGMSTVPEVIVAVHAGLKVLGISCVTDLCFPDTLKPADIREIIKVATEAEPKLTKLVRRVIAELPK